MLRSDTDAEVVAHLIAMHYRHGLADAVRRTLEDVEGHYALVAMCDDEPDTLVGVRYECPLVLGLGDGEQFVASSMPAFLAYTREVVVLGNGEISVMRAGGVEVRDATNIVLRRSRPLQISLDGQNTKQVWTTASTVDEALAKMHEVPSGD